MYLKTLKSIKYVTMRDTKLFAFREKTLQSIKYVTMRDTKLFAFREKTCVSN